MLSILFVVELSSCLSGKTPGSSIITIHDVCERKNHIGLALLIRFGSEEEASGQCMLFFGFGYRMLVYRPDWMLSRSTEFLNLIPMSQMQQSLCKL